eukprot:6181713-Pleurochrysis_carterae.AAC.1
MQVRKAGTDRIGRVAEFVHELANQCFHCPTNVQHRVCVRLHVEVTGLSEPCWSHINTPIVLQRRNPDMIIKGMIGRVQALSEDNEVDVMQCNLSIGCGRSPCAKLRTHGVERKLACHWVGGHRNGYIDDSVRGGTVTQTRLSA